MAQSPLPAPHHTPGLKKYLFKQSLQIQDTDNMQKPCLWVPKQKTNVLILQRNSVTERRRPESHTSDLHRSPLRARAGSGDGQPSRRAPRGVRKGWPPLICTPSRRFSLLLPPGPQPRSPPQGRGSHKKTRKLRMPAGLSAQDLVTIFMCSFFKCENVCL